jgi:hypothetical protein
VKNLEICIESNKENLEVVEVVEENTAKKGIFGFLQKTITSVKKTFENTFKKTDEEEEKQSMTATVDP